MRFPRCAKTYKEFARYEHDGVKIVSPLDTQTRYPNEREQPMLRTPSELLVREKKIWHGFQLVRRGHSTPTSSSQQLGRAERLSPFRKSKRYSRKATRQTPSSMCRKGSKAHRSIQVWQRGDDRHRG